MIRLSQVRVQIGRLKDNKAATEQRELHKAVAKELRCNIDEIQKIFIVKKSIDARKKEEIKYTYTVDVQLEKNIEKQCIAKDKKHKILKPKKVVYDFKPNGIEKLKKRPVIIGAGPAGLFCGLALALAGFAPIILERGKCVEERKQYVEQFWQGKELNPNCNVQFGEGGAGTFSDGKLNTLVKDVSGRNTKVLELFVEHGAPSEILYLHKPHIGTDQLRDIVKAIREHIIALGGEVRFDCQVTHLFMEKGEITGVEVNHKQRIETQVVVLAIGHSARDTFSMLHQQNIMMERKPFAIGVRIEHLQEMIGKSQYGEMYHRLPTADYKLTYQTSKGRSVYSFCMCPGGFVVNSSSEKGHLVVNGMSNYARNEKNANSALVVNVTPEDFGGTSVLAGVEFQRKWEALAYEQCQGKIPTQLFGDFRRHQISNGYGDILPVHKGMDGFANLWNCLPDFVGEALEEGILAFDQKIKGYGSEEALLSGVETRTSSPVRILRNQAFESNVKGLYPCGEGAGYAGGITSAAMDGLRVYEAVCTKYFS